MTIQKFLQRAHMGGWNGKSDLYHENNPEIAAVFLDPTAWQAVGKASGWNTIGKLRMYPQDRDITDAEMQHHLLITALWDGKTIEDFLATLT